jgi:hypothetical protein
MLSSFVVADFGADAKVGQSIDYVELHFVPVQE